MRNSLFFLFIILAACSSAPVDVETVADTAVAKAVSDTQTSAGPDVTIIDRQLVEYEMLIRKYVLVSKKAKKGDVASLTECTSLSVKAKEIENFLLEQASELSEEQQNKLRSLTVTLEKASSEK